MSAILIASRDDWANVGYMFQRAFQAVGIDAKAITLRPHLFGYTEQAECVKPYQVRRLAEQAKGIILMHSRSIVPQDLVERKFSVVFHGGSAYRRNPAGVNRVFNEIVDATITQTHDLLGLGAINEHWIMPPVDTETIRPPRRRTPKKLVIAHYPRAGGTKGTDEIVQTVLKFRPDQFDFRMSRDRVTWPESLKRMGDCDIYVESMRRELNGCIFGEWGVTALEAAALGRIVVTVFGGLKRYEKEYGPCPIRVVKTGQDLRKELQKLLSMNRLELKALRRKTRQWACKYHSFDAIGNRLATIVEPCL